MAVVAATLRDAVGVYEEVDRPMVACVDRSAMAFACFVVWYLNVRHTDKLDRSVLVCILHNLHMSQY